MYMTYDVIIIGGGPAGLFAAAAACGASSVNGGEAKRILILERGEETGGILHQCIHSGFGLHMFKAELTGPEYAERALDMLTNTGIEIKTDTMVLSVTADKTVTAINERDGYMELCAWDAGSVQAERLVLAEAALQGFSQPVLPSGLSTSMAIWWDAAYAYSARATSVL
jgi:thioredoxin reductase